jgi:hypothetical protein
MAADSLNGQPVPWGNSLPLMGFAIWIFLLAGQGNDPRYPMYKIDTVLTAQRLIKYLWDTYDWCTYGEWSADC